MEERGVTVKKLMGRDKGSLIGTAKAVHASKADEGIHWLLWQAGVQPPPGKQGPHQA